MNKTLNFTSLLISCGVAVAMISSSPAQTTQGHATVVRVKGDARASQAGNWKDLKVGDVLSAGTVIQTGLDKGSYVDLVLSEDGAKAAAAPAIGGGSNASGTGAGYKAEAEQNVVRVNENTALGIDKLTYQNTGAETISETQLDLRQGRITGNVKKLSPASKYEIKLPNGVAGIRGTLFELSADGLLRVRVGSVVLAYVGPNGDVITQTVGANEQYDAHANKLSPLAAGSVQTLETMGTEMRSGARAMIQNEVYLDQTIHRISPSKGKGKGKGKGNGNGNDGSFPE